MSRIIRFLQGCLAYIIISLYCEKKCLKATVGLMLLYDHVEYTRSCTNSCVNILMFQNVSKVGPRNFVTVLFCLVKFVLYLLPIIH